MQYFTLFIFLFITAQLYGQSYFDLDPRSEGRANTFSVETGAGSLFVNPSGSAMLEGFTAIFAGQNIAGLEGLHTSGIAIGQPTRFGVIGAIFGNTGDELLNHSGLALNWAQKLGIAQLGLRTGIINTSIEGQKSKNSFQLDFSGIVKLSPILSVGAGISNLTKSKYTGQEQIPVTGNFGLDIHPTRSFHLTMETEKDLAKKPEYKFGCSYSIKERIEILTGINIRPLRQSLGLGFTLRKFIVQWSLTNLPGLGSKQSISLCYKTSKKKDA
jgi:hypothetical protein